MNWEPGFDDMDSIYASPDDFRQMRERNKAKGLHLLEFFVKKCHDIGVNDSFKLIDRSISVFMSLTCITVTFGGSDTW